MGKLIAGLVGITVVVTILLASSQGNVAPVETTTTPAVTSPESPTRTKPVTPAVKPTTPVLQPSLPGTIKLPASYYVSMAAVKERYGLLDEARQLYKTAIDIEPSPQSKARYLCLAGNIELKMKQLEDAKQLFTKSISLLQNKGIIERLKFSIADMYVNTGHDNEAKALLNELVANATNEAMRNRARQSLLKVNKQKGGIEGLIHQWEDKLKNAPDDQGTMKALAEAYASSRTEREKSLPLFDKLIATEKDNRQKANFCVLGAKAAKSLRQQGKAVSYLDMAIKCTETKQARCKYHFLRAESLSAAGKANEAEESFRFIEENSSSSREKTIARNQRLVLAKQQNKVAEAGIEYTEKLKKNPNDTDALAALVHLHWGVSRNAKMAKPYILSLSKLQPKEAQTLQMKADIHNALKEYDDSLSTYQQALSICPANKQFYLERMTSLYRRLDKNKEAVKCVDEMAKSADSSSYRAGRIANLYLQVGETVKGEDYFKKAISSARSDKEKEQLRLQAASAFTNAKEPSKARAMLEAVIKESKSEAMVSHAKSMLARLK